MASKQQLLRKKRRRISDENWLKIAGHEWGACDRAWHHAHGTCPSVREATLCRWLRNNRRRVFVAYVQNQEQHSVSSEHMNMQELLKQPIDISVVFVDEDDRITFAVQVVVPYCKVIEDAIKRDAKKVINK